MPKASRKKKAFDSLWLGAGRFAPFQPAGHFNLTYNDPITLRHWRPNYQFIGLSELTCSP
jgi:hypothetical protein